MGHVYVEGEVIADYHGTDIYSFTSFQHRNLTTGQWVEGGLRTELDPLGADVGYTSPYAYNMTYSDIMGSDDLYSIRGNALDIRGGCALDGMSISCSFLNEMMQSETNSVALQYQLSNGRFLQGEIRHFGAGIFMFEYPHITRDIEPGGTGYRLGWRLDNFAVPQDTRTICERMADDAQRIANDAIRNAHTHEEIIVPAYLPAGDDVFETFNKNFGLFTFGSYFTRAAWGFVGTWLRDEITCWVNVGLIKAMPASILISKTHCSPAPTPFIISAHISVPDLWGGRLRLINTELMIEPQEIGEMYV